MTQVAVTNLSGEGPIGSRVFESRQGKILTIQFPSGRFVRVYMEFWGMSLVVQALGSDHGFTRGLCGIFDGDPSNEFHDRDGRIMEVEMSYGQVDQFAEQWR